MKGFVAFGLVRAVKRASDARKAAGVRKALERAWRGPLLNALRINRFSLEIQWHGRRYFSQKLFVRPSKINVAFLKKRRYK